jgi:membrane protease YdiL (CAAX protease family)
VSTGVVLGIVGLWLLARTVGPSAAAPGLVLGIAVGLVAAMQLRRRRGDHPRIGLQPLAGAAAAGAALATLAILASWRLGHDGGANWALRQGLELGWWTDRLPFLPGKLLAVLVGAAIVATVVIPDELVTRGVLLQDSQQRGWSLRRQLALQGAITATAGLGGLWQQAAPATVVLTHVVTLVALAVAATLAARRTQGVLAPILLHAVFRCVLVVHAFAWIPRLYR